VSLLFLFVLARPANLYLSYVLPDWTLAVERPGHIVVP